MDELSSTRVMNEQGFEQDRQISEIVASERLGLLALCRILFGGFGIGGGGHRNSRRRMEGRIRERVRERMAERWEQMTPEEREQFR